MTGERLRVDKWLWYARFCKSRSVAANSPPAAGSAATEAS